MKKMIGLIVLVFVGTAGWRIGNNLSSDAISMAVGIFFGVLAGIPTALLVLAADRHKSDRTAQRREMAHHGLTHQQTTYPAYGGPNQPPVIILNGAGQPMPRQQQHAYGHDEAGSAIEAAGWPQQQRPARRFKVVGEEEAWIE
jgi:hypothetical protein